MSIFYRLSVKTVFEPFLASLLSSYRGSTTPPPQTAAVEAPPPPRPQHDIESGGGAATTHNQQNASPSMEEGVLPCTRRIELYVLVMFASVRASLRSTFHGPPTTPGQPQTAAAAARQPVLLPLQGIESDGSTAPTTHSQHNALPSMKKLAMYATVCIGVGTLVPPLELLHSQPLRCSLLLASVCLTVVAASLSLLWHRIPHYHQRSFAVAVVSSNFSCLLRILLLIPGKSLIFVAGFFLLEIGFAALYVLSPPRLSTTL